jgi:hypothetical protein
MLDPDVARWTAAELQDLRRDLAISLGLAPPSSPMGIVIHTQIAAIDTELARRPADPGLAPTNSGASS